MDIHEGKHVNFPVSWEEYEKEVKGVGDKLKKEKSLKEIVALKRGGLIGGVLLSHYLNLPLKVLSIDKLLNSTQEDFQDINVLLWDDVSDGGNTFTIAKNNLKKFYADVLTASVYITDETRFTPDYYSRIVPKHYWIVFPWEINMEGIV